MTSKADAVVVGAGVIGASISLGLAQLGLDVVVVDKSGGAGQGSTSASSAIIRFNYSRWDGVAASWESKHCWEHWSDYLGHVDGRGLASFNKTGMVMLDVPVAPWEHVLKLFDRAGVPYERWDAPTLQSRIPAIDVGRYWPPKAVDDEAFFADAVGVVGGVYMPEAGFVGDPQLAAQNLASAAAAKGAQFVFNRRVVEIKKTNGKISGVRLSSGDEIETRILVNATGPWSRQFNELAGIGSDFAINVRPMRQEVHSVPAPRDYSEKGRLGPIIADLDLGTYIRTASDGLYIGGTEPECDPMEWIEDPDEADPRVTARQFEAQVMRAAQRLPSLIVPNIPKGVAGVYDVADDWAPIYDRTDVDGCYVAIGTSGNQFKNAPIVGRMMATLIDRVEAGHDHDRDPVRLTGEYTGLEINLGAFSRKRATNLSSSGTVMG